MPPQAATHPAEQPTSNGRWRSWLLGMSLLASVPVTWWLLWWSSIPLGIPGEWEWPRLEPDESLMWNTLVLTLTGLAYATYCFVGWRWFRRQEGTTPAAPSDTAPIKQRSATFRHRFTAALWVVGLAISGAIWLWQVQDCGVFGQQLSKIPFVLYYTGPSGYFYIARYEAPDPHEFLATYEARVAEGDVLHVGTHPPGLFLVFHGLAAVCDRSPALSQAVMATCPESARHGFDSILRHTASSPHSFRPHDQPILWLAGFGVLALSAIGVIPLYELLRRHHSAEVAWLAAGLWPLIPSVAIFCPKSDVLFPTVSLILARSWLRARDGDHIGWSLLAGIVAAVGLLGSLVFLPIFLWLALITLWELSIVPSESRRWELLGRQLITAAIGFAAVWFVLWWSTGFVVWRVLWWNYRNHAAFYLQHPRTYLTWLWVNPLELSFAQGLPFTIVALAGLGICVREWRAGRRIAAQGPCVAALIVWTWLWLTGKNSGEVARLWTFLMAWAPWFAARYFAAVGQARTPINTTLLWICLWLTQLACAGLTVARINGFDLH